MKKTNETKKTEEITLEELEISLNDTMTRRQETDAFLNEIESERNAEECKHAYSEYICDCGKVFCYDCCGGQNVDQGGKYTDDYMYCPECGLDIYEDKAK